MKFLLLDGGAEFAHSKGELNHTLAQSRCGYLTKIRAYR